jgi:L-ribulose-5-phosphate 3-epimerase
MRNQLGLMQGRLLPQIDNKIQAFPIKNWEEEFLLMNKINLGFLEWTFDQKNIFKNPILTHDGKKRIKLLENKFDVKVLTATCDNFIQAPIHKSGSHGKTSLVDLVKFIKRNVGNSIRILVWPLVDGGAISTEGELKKFIEVISEIFELLSESNIKIAFETDFSPENNKFFLRHFPKESFGLNIDVGNSASYGFSILEDLKLNAKSILNIHLKDRPRNGPTVPLGEGSVNWNDVRILVENYKGLIILQCARDNRKSELKTIQDYINFLHLNLF